MRKPLLLVLVAFASVLLLPAAGEARTRDDGSLWFFDGEAGRYDLWENTRLRVDPARGRLFDGFKLVDPDTGVETILPVRATSSFDGNLIVGCEYGRLVVFDVATDTVVHDLGPDDLPTPSIGYCELRDGKVYIANVAGVLVVDLGDYSSSLLTYPGHTMLTVIPGVGREDGVLHVRSAWEYYDIDLADPTTIIGPRQARLPVTANTNSTFDTEGTDIVEYDRQGAVLRTVPCPGADGCDDLRDLYPLDHDRLLVAGSRSLGLLDLASGETLAQVDTTLTEHLNLVDDDHVYMSRDKDVIRIDRDAGYITKAPGLVDLRTATTRYVRTWSLFEPVAVTVDGVAVPFTRATAGVDVDLSGLASGTATITVSFANGATTPPVSIEVIGLPVSTTVFVTAHDEVGQSNDATITMRCTGVYAQVEAKTISSGQRIPFDVPLGAPCEATAAGGRFGPLAAGGFVIDYSTTWPDPQLGDPGTEWHVWVGADRVDPVHWIVLDKSGGSIAQRPATLTCAGRPAWRGDVEYGQLHRFVNDLRTGGPNPCQWVVDEIDGFDGVLVETFGPVTRTPFVYHGDSSTLTIVTDYYLHPDVGPEAFLDAVNRRANGRVSTPGELNWWTPRINDNPGFRGLAVDAIVRSDEYRSRTETIARLYQAYFDRLPDAAGLAYWADVASRGTSLLTISSYFADSEEFRRKYGGADNARFVSLAYDNVLGRPPDGPGYDYWLRALEAGTLDGPGVLFYFSDGAEFRTAMRERLAVTGTYTLVLNRAPTPTELQAGIDSFRATDSLALLANTLLASPDFAASFATHLRP